MAESYGVWGPFLVVTPASTLHNWQQEVARFLPAFTTVPYWGAPGERKVLRSFWNQENLHTKVCSTPAHREYSRVVDPESFNPDPAFQVNRDTDPDPIRIQGFNDKKLKKKIQLKIFCIFFDQKLQLT